MLTNFSRTVLYFLASSAVKLKLLNTSSTFLPMEYSSKDTYRSCDLLPRSDAVLKRWNHCFQAGLFSASKENLSGQGISIPIHSYGYTLPRKILCNSRCHHVMFIYCVMFTY